MADRRQALRNLPEIRRFLLQDVRPTGRTLGVGSYGSVDEVVVSGLLCAGKKIHEVLVNQPVDTIAQKYVAECQLMSELRHPNIVQFLGLCFLEDSTLPVLVMEKLVTSLDEILENTPNIPLGLKKSILMDIARGLIYLHSREPRPIIHRDLSAKNVLLNSSLNAKISDLGNSRIVDFEPGQLARTLSVAPGTTVYMPPEALEETARYGPSLDIFSFGHLSLFTLTQVFPGDLLRHTYSDPNNRRRLIGRSEVERRQSYFTSLYHQLGERHPLVQLTERCLDNDSEYRPSAVDVLQQLEAVEIEDPYQHLTKLDMIQLLQQRTDPQREEEIQRLQTQLQQLQLDATESRTQRDRAEEERERTAREKDEVIREKNAVIYQLQLDVAESRTQRDRAEGERERIAREKDEVIREKDEVTRQLQLDVAESRTQRDRAEGERETTAREKDEVIQGKDEVIRKLQAGVTEKDRDVREKDRAMVRATQEIWQKEQVIRKNEELIQALQEEVRQKDGLLRQGVPMPKKGRAAALAGAIPRRRAASVSMAVLKSRKSRALLAKTEVHFEQLRDLPTSMHNAQAVIYRGTLYVGGGETSDDDFVLCAYNFKPDTWDTIKTPTRYYALAVYQDQLVLAGGCLPDSGTTPTDQLWLTNNRQHTFKQTMPPMITATTTAIAIATQTHLIIAGGDNGLICLKTVQVYDGKHWAHAQPLPVPDYSIKHTVHDNNLYLMGGEKQDKKVYYTSLPSLIQTHHQRKTTVWNTLTDVPLPHSSIAVLQSHLVAIGGGSDFSQSPSLHFYSDKSRRWEEMEGVLPQPLTNTCSITLPTGELLVIGGYGMNGMNSSHVYKAT